MNEEKISRPKSVFEELNLQLDQILAHLARQEKRLKELEKKAGIEFVENAGIEFVENEVPVMAVDGWPEIREGGEPKVTAMQPLPDVDRCPDLDALEM